MRQYVQHLPHMSTFLDKVCALCTSW